jgi:aminoacylase
MKCVGIQHIEAVAALKNSGKQPLRTIHISLVPDEEIGGNDGMEKWVKTDNFKNLNIGFAMDEGLANPSDVCIVYYGERVPWCSITLFYHA